MIKYQKIYGVNIENSTSLPIITQTPEGLAMGGVPGWSNFIDPFYARESSVRNRAKRSSLLLNTSTFGGNIIKSQVNGNFFINTIDQPVALTGNFGDVSSDQWTFFFVFFGIKESGLSSMQDVFTPISEESNVIAPRIVINFQTGSVEVYENSIRTAGQPVRLHYEMDLDLAESTLIGCTFSVQHGLSIMRNGVTVASDPNDIRPLSREYAGNDMRALSRAVGNFGMMGSLNIDLSAPKNIGHRRAVEKFIMDKYGIL